MRIKLKKKILKDKKRKENFKKKLFNYLTK